MDSFRRYIGWDDKTVEMKKLEEQAKKEAEERERKENAEMARIQTEIAEREKRDQEERDREVKEATEWNLRLTKEKVAGFNEERQASEKLLQEMNSQVESNVEKAIEERKSAAIREVTAKKEAMESDKKQIVEQKKQLAEEVENLAKTKDSMAMERSKLKKENEQQEKASIEKHRELVLKEREASFALVMETEQQQNALQEEHRQFQTQMIEKREELQSVQMLNTYQLVNALDMEQFYDDFRRRARSLIGYFNRFKRFFSLEERYLLSTKDRIREGLPVRNVPDLTAATNSLNDLNAELQQFHCDGASDRDTYEQLRDKVLGLVEELSTVQNGIASNIANYQNEFIENAQTTRSRSEASEFETLDDVSTKSSGSLTPPESLRPLSPNVSASEKFSIVELFEKNQNLIRDISRLMPKFHVPESTQFHGMLTAQVQQLSIGTNRSTLRITEGASSSQQAALEDSNNPKKEDESNK